MSQAADDGLIRGGDPAVRGVGFSWSRAKTSPMMTAVVSPRTPISLVSDAAADMAEATL